VKKHPIAILPFASFLLLAGLVTALPAAEFACMLTNARGGDPLAEASVALIPLDQPAPAVPAGTEIEISQENQEFSAFLTIVQNGTKVVLPNRDNVQHHVYSLSRPRRFELPLYNPGQTESIVFELEGQVTIGCNIHDWMISHVVVVPTPWFAKTDDAGAVRVTAPPGRYRLEIWHPRMAKPDTREVTLADGAPAQQAISLTLKPDRRVRRSLGGKTGGYR
jgi:plastocyanin